MAADRTIIGEPCAALLKKSFTICCTFGMRVERDEHDLVTSSGFIPASFTILDGRGGARLRIVTSCELGARERVVRCLAGLVAGDDRQIDVGLLHPGQRHLRLIGPFLQALGASGPWRGDA